ncbi:putative transcription factor MYC2-like [Iris pallida]|uniref:Transcription factor MYC2-like n=1 Tax=Iris pallida TaxID=29817 RepID=A0AAX6IBH2_IRIPA|nr:putative transcription factor MYC2-like [Iris pallida]
MEEQQQLSPLAVTHLLQHTLRSLCIQDNSQWVYAVFWRILPRNYPPPKWDLQGGIYDRTRGNRRNWILVWEDGFCNFAASSCEAAAAAEPGSSLASCEMGQLVRGLQPELFFKMSHEIYNYGEGLIGKVAADHSHKWVFKEPGDQEINFLSSWSNPADSQPRTWEAQFQSGIKTIALIAVREGVVQLGAVNKVMEDLSYVVLLRKKFAYLESIPGVLLPHPSSSSASLPMIVGCGGVPQEAGCWPPPLHMAATSAPAPVDAYDQYYLQQLQQQAMRITPSMSSLEALLSKLPAVAPGEPGPSLGYYEVPMLVPPKSPAARTSPPAVAKEEVDQEYGGSSSMSSYYHANVSKSAGQEF